MADSKITALASIGTGTDPANDPLVIVDVSDILPGGMSLTGTTKKVTLNNLLACSPTATLASATITGDLTVDTSTLKVDSVNNRVGIVNASPTRALDVVGSAIVSSEIRCSTFDTGTTSGDLYLFTSNRLSQTAAPTIECQNSSKPLIINHTGSQSMLFGIGSSLQMTLNSTGLAIGDVPFAGTRLTLRESASQPNALAMTNRNATQTWRIGVDVSAVDDKILGFYDSTSTTFRMQLTDTGNLGIGVQPSAWGGFGNLQLATSGSTVVSGYDQSLGVNYFSHSSGAYKYTVNGNAVKQGMFNGQFTWSVAPSGTAGNTITFTQAMTLTAAGELLVGTTSTAGSASNATKTVGGSFSTVNGATGSIATGVAATLFTAPSESVFMVSAYIVGSSSPANYNAVAIVKVSGGTAAITTVSSALNLTISLSGLNVQATQTSGVNQAFAYSAIRIS